METTWYIKHTDKKVYGPYSQKQIETYLSQNKLSLDSFISPDKTHWGKIADYKKELLAQIIEGDIGNEETVAQPHVQEKNALRTMKSLVSLVVVVWELFIKLVIRELIVSLRLKHCSILQRQRWKLNVL